MQIIALSEQVTTNKPLAVNVGDQPVVLFRDKAGIVCALEDRCPHRRVPLSLGKIIEGDIRCAYHGWTFDGRTGACANIPNLSADEAIPAKLKATSFVVQEHNGFVYFQKADSAPQTTLLPDNIFSAHIYDVELFGCSNVPMGLQEYRAALLDGPETLVQFSGVGMTDYYLGGVVEHEQSVSIDRAADWSALDKKPSWKSPDYPLIVRSELYKQGTTAMVSVLNAAEQRLMEVYLSILPNTRGTSSILWRARRYSSCINCAPIAIRLKLFAFKDFVKVKETICATAINNLMVGPSTTLVHFD